MTSLSIYNKEMAKFTRKISKVRAHYIEMMAAAYLKTTQIPIEEVELIEQMDPVNHLIRFYYSRKDKSLPPKIQGMDQM